MQQRCILPPLSSSLSLGLSLLAQLPPSLQSCLSRHHAAVLRSSVSSREPQCSSPSTPSSPASAVSSPPTPSPVRRTPPHKHAATLHSRLLPRLVKLCSRLVLVIRGWFGTGSRLFEVVRNLFGAVRSSSEVVQGCSGWLGVCRSRSGPARGPLKMLGAARDCPKPFGACSRPSEAVRRLFGVARGHPKPFGACSRPSGQQLVVVSSSFCSLGNPYFPRLWIEKEMS